MKGKLDIWLSVVMGVNCSNGLQISQSGLTPEEIYKNRKNLAGYGIFTESQIKRGVEIEIGFMDGIHKRHTANDISSVNCFDENYPTRFKNIYNLPVVLFYKGDLSLMESKYTVGIVGSRHPSGESEKVCTIIAGDVATNGGVVVSGIAQGVDSLSQKACVKAGGKTIAVTGVPLDEYYPKTNEAFQKQLEKEHLVISEYYAGYEYQSSSFVHRNRLIAAASDGLCIIQAKKKSGSLATVNKAIEYDKPVFTVPAGVFDAGCEGSNNLLYESKAHAVANGTQIMEYLGVKTRQTKKKKLPPVSDTAKQVLKFIDKPMFTAGIVKAVPLPAGLVKAAITELEVAGYITKTASGEYIRF